MIWIGIVWLGSFAVFLELVLLEEPMDGDAQE
jgi:hypothetical protein